MAAFVVAFIGVAASASPIGAQALIFRGRVIDDSTQAPISEVTIQVLTDDLRPASPTTRTDSGGNFILQVKSQGYYRLKANRIGYREVITPSFKTMPGLVTVLELVMSERVQLLAPLSIRERYRPSAAELVDPLADFEYRRRTGGGNYFTAKDIRERNAFKVTDMLRGMAGVRVADVSGTATVTMARALSALSGGTCAPPVFLDGLRLMMEPMATINSLPIDHITGIEVYKGPATVPGEFMITGTTCGAIVVWTRRGFGTAPPPK
jgi:hypothetical protein